MTRILKNSLLHPTKRAIENWNRDFRTIDGPNTSSFINLDDIAIPYDSHYVSKIVLPSNSLDYHLSYSETLDGVTFLLIKVTYNGNYDNEFDDSFDPLYKYEQQNYNINYYFESDSGKTYPIGKLLLLNGSVTNKLENVYLNNPLDYDVVLDVFQANISENIHITPINSAVTINNLYFSDIITDQLDCFPTWYTTTTTTTPDSGITTTTTTTNYTTTTTTIIKDGMKIYITSENDSLYKSGYIRYNSTGDTFGIFDYYKNNEWIFDGATGNFIEFTDISDIDIIRFYFYENDKYYGTLKTDYFLPINHNNDMYFIDILTNGEQLNPNDYGTSEYLSGNTVNIDVLYNSGLTNIYTGSTEFIISEYVVSFSVYSIITHNIPYYSINDISKNIELNYIYIDTTVTYFTLTFLTTDECNRAYNRLLYVYNSYNDGNCSYLTVDNIYENNIIIEI